MRKFALCLATALTLSACTVSGTASSINTAELAADASAIDFAAQAIEAIPSLSGHLTADQVASVNAALANIKTITAEINAASGGSIAIDTGKNWTSSLVTEFNTILSVAGTVASTLDPSVAGYITTAHAIIPLIEAAVGLNAASVSASAHVTEAPTQVRAEIYRGV